MKKGTKAVVSSLMIAFALAGCTESPQDLARKPDMVSSMVTASAEICQTGPVHADAAAYKERLSNVLMRVRASDLDTFQKEKITICLDQRLPQQNHGFWDTKARAIYYNGSDAQTKIVSLTDTGAQPQEVGFFGDHYNTPYYRGDDALHFLAKKTRNHETPAAGTKMYAGLYGKNNDIYWKAAGHFDKDTVAKNPQLQTPPVKTSVSFKFGS